MYFSVPIVCPLAPGQSPRSIGSQRGGLGPFTCCARGVCTDRPLYLWQLRPAAAGDRHSSLQLTSVCSFSVSKVFCSFHPVPEPCPPWRPRHLRILQGADIRGLPFLVAGDRCHLLDKETHPFFHRALTPPLQTLIFTWSRSVNIIFRNYSSSVTSNG